MTLAVHWATTAMGPEKLQEVTEFFQKVKSKEIDPAAHCSEDDFMCQWMAPFMPNLLNTVVFLPHGNLSTCSHSGNISQNQKLFTVSVCYYNSHTTSVSLSHTIDQSCLHAMIVWWILI